MKFWAETLRNGGTQQNGFADYTLDSLPKTCWAGRKNCATPTEDYPGHAREQAHSTLLNLSLEQVVQCSPLCSHPC